MTTQPDSNPEADGSASQAPDVVNEHAARQDFPPATLYVVATPIGNLADMSARAIECLHRVDAVAAEDTRVTRQLLAHYGLSKPCFAAHQHNEHEAAQSIIARLVAGERIALVSDAGTPGISDPGAQIVRAVLEHGLRVIPIPGASALTVALSAAGALPGPVVFAGFLPAKRGQAEKTLASLVALEATLVFYEAPHRIVDTARLLAESLGPTRRVVILRELTKLFESIAAMPLSELAGWLGAERNRERGEFVLVVDPAPLATAQPDSHDVLLARLMRSLSLSEAVDLAVELTSAPRKQLYARALVLRDQVPDT
jgi:16S rRNA (cytidine1402-2'-O)-methyltransferase